MTYKLSEEKLKKTSKILLKDLHATLGIDKSVLSNNQLLQKISQALFSKPFEEVQKVIFAKETHIVVDTIPVSRIFIFHYGGDAVLTVDGEIEGTTFDNDEEMDFNNLFNHALLEANRLGAFPFEEVSLPTILECDWDSGDVVNLAKKMGYFTHNKTLFQLIDSSKMKILDDLYLSFGLKDEWKTKIVSEYDGESEIGKCNIWYIEVEDDDIDENEHATYYDFTFDDICGAVLSDGKWFINDSNRKNSEFIISFN